MGLRHSIAANIVFTQSVPSEIIRQLDQLISFTEDSELGKLINKGYPITEGFSEALVSLFRNHRAYGATWNQRRCVTPGKHYVVYGTTKHGDSHMYAAVEYLEPYLDLEKSWFVALSEGSEIAATRWNKVGNKFIKQELIADLYRECSPDPFDESSWELLDVDCQDIPWWYAEPIAKTLGTREFNKVVKRLGRLGLGCGKIVVQNPIFNPKLRYPAGTWRYTYLHRKVKKGKGRIHHRIGTFYPAIK